MTGNEKHKLPQRQMDDEAIGVFKGIMRNIERDNGGDASKCWEWPEAWPASWEEKPEGYSVSRKPKGYGQFVLLEINDVAEEKPLDAHPLAYRYYNKKLNPSLSVPELEGAEWAGEYYLRKSIKDNAGNVMVKRRLVRHDHGEPLGQQKCVSKACVNPFHLGIGTDWQNTQLDEAVKAGIVELSPAASDCMDHVIADFKNGELSAEVLCKRYSLKPNDVVNIIKAAGLSSSELFHDFNQIGLFRPPEEREP